MTQPRKMPSKKRITAFWEERADKPGRFFGVSCWACGAVRHTDRAHLVDRYRGGSDDPSNVVLLCQRCHVTMPSFGPDDLDVVWAWMASQPDDTIRLLTVCKGLAEHLGAERFAEFFGVNA